MSELNFAQQYEVKAAFNSRALEEVKRGLEALGVRNYRLLKIQVPVESSSTPTAETSPGLQLEVIVDSEPVRDDVMSLINGLESEGAVVYGLCYSSVYGLAANQGSPRDD